MLLFYIHIHILGTFDWSLAWINLMFNMISVFYLLFLCCFCFATAFSILSLVIYGHCLRIRPIYRWLHVKKNTTHKENIYTIKINATTYYVVDTETTLFSVQPIHMAHSLRNNKINFGPNARYSADNFRFLYRQTNLPYFLMWTEKKLSCVFCDFCKIGVQQILCEFAHFPFIDRTIF